ncbi:hypothetical protein R5W23_001245 [Gemmata sp. JC673]|uniref:Uncharacterized protein n=1 Tax=Gemmata algarum TaxID=2975278 RepID=A0ABU5EZI0_9BACT|nr:hypothetical protein [Gemmata algarum]MDY3560022.1 hypothetical protein [Gemmata algarum]
MRRHATCRNSLQPKCRFRVGHVNIIVSRLSNTVCLFIFFVNTHLVRYLMHDETMNVTNVPSVQTGRERKRTGTSTPKPRSRTRKKTPAQLAAEIEAVAAHRVELATARDELGAARREAAEAVERCREAETRVAAARADADATRRVIAKLDASTSATRGLADAVRMELNRSREGTEEIERRAARLRDWLSNTRSEFAAIAVEAETTLDQFRITVSELRTSRLAPEHTEPEVDPEAPPTPAFELPTRPALAPDERAADLRVRLIHLLNNTWAVEKELIGLFQTLADECGDRGVRELLETQRGDAEARQETLGRQLEGLGERPTGGRGMLGQLVTRIWDAVQAPRDQPDRAALALLKGL